MSRLWIYGRRPAGLVRYWHGGYNGLYPTRINWPIAYPRPNQYKTSDAHKNIVPFPDQARPNSSTKSGLSINAAD
ncbi:MAG: hypothetical protein AAF418_00020 [Pseudomonadota bacterium]